VTASELAEIRHLRAKLENLEDRYKTLLASMGAVHTALTALAPLSSAGSAQCSFLASLTQMAHLPNDNSTGSTWITGERDFYNNLKAACVSSNYMA
jgi:hypothetical protein